MADKKPKYKTLPEVTVKSTTKKKLPNWLNNYTKEVAESTAPVSTRLKEQPDWRKLNSNRGNLREITKEEFDDSQNYDTRPFDSEGRAKERQAITDNFLKKTSAVTQFIPNPWISIPSMIVNSTYGALDSYDDYNKKDYLNTGINAAGAFPWGAIPKFGIYGKAGEIAGAATDFTNNFGLENKKNGGWLDKYSDGGSTKCPEGYINIDGNCIKKDSDEYRNLLDQGKVGTMKDDVWYGNKAELEPITIYSNTDKDTQQFYDKLKQYSEDIEDDGKIYETLLDLGQKYGHPKVSMKNTPSFFDPKYSKGSSRENKVRPHYNPFTQRMTISDDPENFIDQYTAELAHQKQVMEKGPTDFILKNIGQVPNIITKGYQNLYKTPGTTEYEAHEEIEPGLKNELGNKYSKSSFTKDYYNLPGLFSDFNPNIKYKNGGPVQENYNNNTTSYPPGFVGMGNNTQGRNYSPAWGGSFEDGGSIPQAQNGRATRDDSLAVYNNSKKVEEFYNKNNYKPAESRGRIYNTATDENNSAYNRFKKNHSKLSINLVNPSVSQRFFGLSNEDYRKEIDKNKYLQREYTYGTMNMDAPMQLYDRRIEPMTSKSVSHKSGDFVEIKTYNNIANKPFDLLTEKEKIQRVKEFGTDGVPKSYLDKIKNQQQPYLDKNQYNKNYPPIYVTNPKDPRIGQYSSIGNQYVYKPQPKPQPKIKHKNFNVQPIGIDKNYNPQITELQHPDITLPTIAPRFPKGDYQYVYGPANSTIGRNYNGQFYPEDIPEQRGKVNQPDLDLLNNDAALRKYVQQKSLKYAMGGSIPGATGFSYGRIGDIPSNGPYAKKTKASAENGKEMSYYQNGLDWKPRNISRDGSVIKDDMGYWNPNNHGKVVEISSPNITMEGVYQPLLGISDTGDTKLMKPGKNYKFKGKKVTEFPVGKNGVNQQDQKTYQHLNQLLNFTNYNKPQPKGWLEKYN